jgi:hypothetical protein
MRPLLSNRPLRRPFVVTLAVASTLGGCGGTATPTPGEPAHGVDASNGPPHNPPNVVLDGSISGGCPADQPTQGAACGGNGICSYESTDCAPASNTATCRDGSWVVAEIGCSHNPPAFIPDAGPADASLDAPAAAACPSKEPVSLTRCTAPASEVCQYPSSDCPGFSDSATCQAGVWEVAAVGCSHNPPPMDAGGG